MSTKTAVDEIVIDYEKDPWEHSDEEVKALLDAAEERIGGEFGRLIGELRQSSVEDSA